MSRGHYDNREWYNKKNPLDKYFYKVTGIYLRASEELRRKTIAKPLDSLGTRPDMEIRYKI